jgi:hypothetical protein
MRIDVPPLLQRVLLRWRTDNVVVLAHSRCCGGCCTSLSGFVQGAHDGHA